MTADQMARSDGRLWNAVRVLGWGGLVGLLLLPLVAMQFTDEVDWTPGDFIVAGVMLGSVGAAFELAARARSWAYRGAAAAAIVAAFLLTWSNLAVGFIGDGDHPVNLLCFGIVLAALLGGLLVRFRAAGMAVVMLAPAAGQVVLGAVAFAGGETAAGRAAVLLTGLWLASALLFRRAARG